MAFKSALIRNKDQLNLLDNTTRYVDIDYAILPVNPDGTWDTRTRSTIVRDERAILNAYRMWLQSKQYDYNRRPGFGGLFQNNLNDRVYFSPDNEDEVAQIIRSETEEKWPDITIMGIEVKAIMKDRSWHIRIIAQDKQTKLVLTDQLSVNVPDQ